jgi:hypothetical protein
VAFAAHADRLAGLRLGRFDADAMLVKLWPDEGAEATKARRAEGILFGDGPAARTLAMAAGLVGAMV